MATRADTAARDLAVAWAESPLQLLNIAEYAAASGVRASVGMRDGVPSLAPTLAAIQDFLPESIADVSPRSLPGRLPRGGGALIAGDAYSGIVKAWLVSHSRRAVVLVDDGSASLATAQDLAVFAPLKRFDSRAPRLDRPLAAAAARRLRHVQSRGDLTMFTAYSTSAPMAKLADSGVTVVPNTYSWLRSLPPVADAITADVIVVGSALATDGHITHDAYLAWLRRAAAGTRVAYLPHRRENAEAVLAELGREAVTLIRSVIPAELMLARVRPGQRIAALPSSIVATVSAIAPQANLVVDAIKPEWWTPTADPAVKAMASEVARG
jgi:hypothetical protein